jgi:ubiquinone/menaquinone biosynthesis C-methylase UbiE
VTQPQDESHYSYSIYADQKFAEQFDQSHFGGPIGRLVFEAQEQVLVEFLGDLQNVSLLDVGTGTGRAALAFAQRGAHVTGVDSSPEMLKVAATHASDLGVAVDFRTGDAHALAFPDRTFDLTVSLRMLMHTPDWRRCLGELCRVSRRQVLFDYPPTTSASTLQVGMRRVQRLFGRRVETYHVLGNGEVRSVLAANGFRIAKIHRQFVLPIALHKLVGSPRFTRTSERFLSVIGLLRIFGAPVTILAERIP